VLAVVRVDQIASGAESTSKDTNSEQAVSNRALTTTVSKSPCAANSVRAVASRRCMTSADSVPRPVSLACSVSQSGGGSTLKRLRIITDAELIEAAAQQIRQLSVEDPEWRSSPSLWRAVEDWRLEHERAEDYVHQS